MSFLWIAGSPSGRSRSDALQDAVQLHLELRNAAVKRLLIGDLSRGQIKEIIGADGGSEIDVETPWGWATSVITPFCERHGAKGWQ